MVKPRQTPAAVDDTQQLRFVVGFTRTDLDGLRPGDWQNLRHDIRAFLHDGDEEFSVASAGRESFYSSEDPLDSTAVSEARLRHIQSDLRSLLEKCVALRDREVLTRKGRTVPEEVADRIGDTTGHFDLHLQRLPVMRGDHVSGLVRGRLRDVLIEKVYRLLRDHPIKPVQNCPECGRLFYRVRKQQYCERECFKRAWARRKGERATAAKATGGRGRRKTR